MKRWRKVQARRVSVILARGGRIEGESEDQKKEITKRLETLAAIEGWRKKKPRWTRGEEARRTQKENEAEEDPGKYRKYRRKVRV